MEQNSQLAFLVERDGESQNGAKDERIRSFALNISENNSLVSLQCSSNKQDTLFIPNAGILSYNITYMHVKFRVIYSGRTLKRFFYFIV